MLAEKMTRRLTHGVGGANNGDDVEDAEMPQAGQHCENLECSSKNDRPRPVHDSGTVRQQPQELNRNRIWFA